MVIVVQETDMHWIRTKTSYKRDLLEISIVFLTPIKKYDKEIIAYFISSLNFLSTSNAPFSIQDVK